mgnify:CR=1 FL=1
MEIQTIITGKLCNNTYLVISKQGNAVMIDPGVGTAEILRALHQSGAHLSYILLTHGHYDHTASVAALMEETGAKSVLHRRDAQMLCDDHKCMSYLFTKKPAVFEPSLLSQDGTEIILDELTFTFISTPGHTRGSCVIRCGDVLFTGDTVLEGTVGRTDFYSGSEELMIQSVRRLSAMEGDFRLLCGHGSPSTLSRERCENAYFVQYG